MANWNSLREPRLGIMLHYDASASDAGAVAWLKHDPRCMVSYNWLVLDNGNVVDIAPANARAWHAGVCKPSEARLKYADANSAFYGVSIAANQNDTVTPAAREAVVALCVRLFQAHRWSKLDAWRIVGHRTEAWPRGRKVDPEGPDPDHPVLSTLEVRCALTLAMP